MFAATYEVIVGETTTTFPAGDRDSIVLGGLEHQFSQSVSWSLHMKG